VAKFTPESQDGLKNTRIMEIAQSSRQGCRIPRSRWLFPIYILVYINFFLRL